MNKLRRPKINVKDYNYIITENGRLALSLDSCNKEMEEFLEDIDTESRLGLPWVADWQIIRLTADGLGTSIEALIDEALEKDYIRLFCTDRYNYYNDNDKRKYYVAMGHERLILALRAESYENAKNRIKIWIAKNWQLWIDSDILSDDINNENIDAVYNFLFMDMTKERLIETNAEYFNNAFIEMEIDQELAPIKSPFSNKYDLNDDEELGIYLPILKKGG